MRWVVPLALAAVIHAVGLCAAMGHGSPRAPSEMIVPVAIAAIVRAASPRSGPSPAADIHRRSDETSAAVPGALSGSTSPAARPSPAIEAAHVAPQMAAAPSIPSIPGPTPPSASVDAGAPARDDQHEAEAGPRATEAAPNSGAGAAGAGSGSGGGPAAPVSASSGSGAGRGGQPAADQRGLIEERIRQHRRYPQLARRRSIEGTVGLLLSIRPDGSVAVRVVRSVDPLLDEAAREAVIAAAPFPPLAGAFVIDLDFSLTDP